MSPVAAPNEARHPRLARDRPANAAAPRRARARYRAPHRRGRSTDALRRTSRAAPVAPQDLRIGEPERAEDSLRDVVNTQLGLQTARGHRRPGEDEDAVPVVVAAIGTGVV